MTSSPEQSTGQSAPQPPPIAIPSNAAGAMPALPLWAAQDYQLFATKESAAKLASCAVAPLVAAARGYRHIALADKQSAQDTGVGSLVGATGARFKKLIGRDGALYLPWYRPAVARREPTGRPGSSANQFRPIEPLFNEKSGKYAKYEFVAGQPTVLDIHPATPGSWLEYTPTVLVTEGILKGDSGMTGMLRAAGISDTELRYDDETVDALTALRALLNQVPEADRVMILSFGGVANWHAHPEWSDMLLKNRTVLVAFDGDLATNPDVHKQGVALWKKLSFMGAIPKLLDLNVVTATTAGAESRKVGLDDYLAQDGPFESLAGRIRDELPPSPAPEDGGGNWQPGDWRMNEEELISQEYREIRTDVGVAARWEPKTRFIGRVSKTMATRGATDEEIETGALASDDDADADATVEIKVSFLKEGVHRDFIIRGPDTMLSDQPMMWANKARTGGTVPTDVLRHRDWPPPVEWLSGMKGHREDETEVTTKWGHMGWVPVENGSPVFIVGTKVIGRYGKSLAGTPGVTESILAGATKFGVHIPDSEEEFKNAAVQIWRAYRDEVWTDPRVAALVLGAALRPVVPKPCRSALLFSGGRRLGKSLTAGFVMSFWADRPGIWTNNSLPGSAEDTMAATESALARTPLWVIDDWAPSEDARKAAADSTKLGAIIRAVHNHTGKRRSNRDLTSQEVQLPRALLIITAEHEHNVGSVADRLIHVPFVKGSLGLKVKTDVVVNMQVRTNLAATVTGGAIKMLAAAPDWEKSYRGYVGEYGRIKDAAQEAMSGNDGSGGDTRHVEMAADLALGLLLWLKIFRHFGLRKEMAEALQSQDDLFSLCKDHLASQQETTPGAAVIKALRAVLAAGQAHIASVDGQGAPPVANSDNGGLLNPMLGWRNGPEGARGGGDPIGYLVMPPKGSSDQDPVILIHQVNGFLAAKRHHPELIMHGSQPAATWASAWNEGFCALYWTPKKMGSGRSQAMIRKMVNGIPVEGVPIKMSALLALNETASEVASEVAGA